MINYQMQFILDQPQAIFENAFGGYLDLAMRIATGDAEITALGQPTAAATLARVRHVGSTTAIPIVGIIQPDANVITEWYGGTSCSEIRQAIKQALFNPQCDEILLLVDSPGGSVIGLEETANVIAEANAKKPVTSFVTSMCASAAYWLASQSGKIVANPSAAIGSIGAVIMHADLSKAYNRIGITHTPIQYGKHKTDGSSLVPLTEQATATIQERVDSYGNQFIHAVARGRRITTKDVQDRYGEGKLFIASQAMKHGLIDGIGTLT